MLTGHFSGIFVAAKSRADSGMLVSRDRYTDTRSANENTECVLFKYLLAKVLCRNGVVYFLAKLDSEVYRLIAFLCRNVLAKLVLELDKLTEKNSFDVFMTSSCTEDDLPASVKKYL